MDKKNIEIRSVVDSGVVISVERHGHLKNFDMTQIKTKLSGAKGAGKILAGYFINTPIDTIVALGGTNLIGAFMAEYLTLSGANVKQDIGVVTPETFDGRVVFGEGYLPIIMNNHVLILKDKVGTKDIKNDIEGVKYYGGHLVGVAGVYGDEVELSVPFEKIFEERDIIKHLSDIGD